MKKALALLLAVILTAGLFTSCRKNKLTALYFAVDGAAGSFDPQIAASSAVRIVVRNCFEGLVSVDPSGQILPAAAERWSVSPDGRTYTFTLRQGAKWHVSNTVKSELGEKLPADFAPEVTAEDFVFALRRAVDPVTNAPDAKKLANIEGAQAILSGIAAPETLGVRAEGPYTLVITLERQEPGFPETLAEPLCMPCNRTFFEATGGRYGLLMKYIISNGPFYLTRFETNSFRLARDPEYTGPHAAKTDVVWLYSGYTEEELLTKLREKDLSGAYLRQIAAENAKVKKATALSAGNTVRGLLFNCRKGALSNMNVRKAFFAASAPGVLCEAMGRDKTDAVCPQTLSPQLSAAGETDGGQAAELLAAGLEELGLTDVSFTLLCEAEYDTALRRFLQDWQKAFGVSCAVHLQTVTAAEMEAKVRAGEFDIAFYPASAGYYEPSAYFAQFSATAGGMIENEFYDSAVEALRYASADERAQAQATAERRLIESAVLLPVWQEGDTFLLIKGVTGVTLLGGSDRVYFYGAENK